MTTATYASTSPYFNTQTWGQFLDVWGYNTLTIPPDVTDALYQIDPPYNRRPDLLAYDMYQDTNLWWIFAVRNPDILIDPVFSFVAPNVIYVPTRAIVKSALGV
jgi:hypothetical protein